LNYYGLESNHDGLQSPKPDIQAAFKKPGGHRSVPEHKTPFEKTRGE